MPRPGSVASLAAANAASQSYGAALVRSATTARLRGVLRSKAVTQVPASPDSSVPALVAAHMRTDITRRADHLRVGPFFVGLDPHSASLGRNYAIPLPDARPSRAEILDLIAAFESRQRTPRLECVAGIAPQAETALVDAGFRVDQRLAMLACPPGSVVDQPLPRGVVMATVTAADDLLETAALQNEAYGGTASASQHDVDRLQALIERGGIVALARDLVSGEACGAGLVTEAVDGLAEVAAVATRASYRRRGIASSLASLLTRSAHDRGARLVFLDVEGPAEEAVYLRVGYARAGERVWLSKPG